MVSRAMPRLVGALIALALAGAACDVYDQSLPPKIDAGPDAGDAATDDAAVDGGADAGPDASPDAAS